MGRSEGAGPSGLVRSVNRCGAGGAGGRAEAEGKPFEISKRVVWEAYEKVKANKGAAGVDGESIAEFERD